MVASTWTPLLSAATAVPHPSSPQPASHAQLAACVEPLPGQAGAVAGALGERLGPRRVQQWRGACVAGAAGDPAEERVDGEPL